MTSRNGQTAESAQGRPLVLVVDDNVDNQELLRYLLEWLGVSVELVGNGVQAIAAFARAEYAAVLMDCEMPHMDGFQATAELRRLESPGRRTPILAITAHAVRDVHDRCVAAGMDDCLSKPVGAEDLRAALAPVLREQRRVLAAPAGVCEVDLASLAVLAEQIGPDALGMLLETFWAETDKRLTRLRDAVTAGDPQEVAVVAHGLKGGAASLGALRLAELSGELQRLADGGSLADAEDRVTGLGEVFARAKQVTTELMDSIHRRRLAGADAEASA